MTQQIPIQTLHLFPKLDALLIDLLGSLTDDEWSSQTVAKRWNVKDVAAHLLDGNIRGLSTSRDGFFGVRPENIDSYDDLVAFLNELNLSWTDAAKRISPRVLIFLLEKTGQQYTEHLNSLDPFGDAIFSVAWAGHDRSPNWFHIAREYTERFLHQQQIRDAVNKPGIMTREFFYPFMDTLMHAFPFRFRDVSAKNGAVVSMVITGAIDDAWHITKREDGWILNKGTGASPNAIVKIDADVVWKLFSKSWRPKDVMDKVSISGDKALGEQALDIVAVMA